MSKSKKSQKPEKKKSLATSSRKIAKLGAEDDAVDPALASLFASSVILSLVFHVPS
jgi:hypothetical protein